MRKKYTNFIIEKATGEFLAKLIRKTYDDYGADYILAGPLAERLGAVGSELWICNVTHDVLSDHPESIYIHDIE